MKVSIEELMYLESRLAEINSVPLEEIVWTSFGKELEISQKAIEEFKFCGLNNVSFITTGWYLGEGLEEKVD